MNNEKMESSATQILDLHQLIAAPLLATLDADSLVTQRYLDYLFSVAFESGHGDNGQVGGLRMLHFTYHSDDNHGGCDRRVSVPLLSLVPLPLLNVKQAVFDFQINILDAVSTQQQEVFSFAQGDVLTPVRTGQSEGLRMRASLAPTQGGVYDSSSRHTLTANMKVHISMGQADMPGGLANLLRLAATEAVMF